MTSSSRRIVAGLADYTAFVSKYIYVWGNGALVSKYIQVWGMYTCIKVFTGVGNVHLYERIRRCGETVATFPPNS